MKKYIRERFKGILKLDDSPHKLAAAFALGVFIAFSPTIGLHTISCLLFAWMFRLSKLVVFTSSMLVNNPWTIVPLYGSCLWFGMHITVSGREAPHIAWNELNFSNAYVILKPYLWPFVAGTLVAGVVAAIVAYVLFYLAVLRFRKINR